MPRSPLPSTSRIGLVVIVLIAMGAAGFALRSLVDARAASTDAQAASTDNGDRVLSDKSDVLVHLAVAGDVGTGEQNEERTAEVMDGFEVDLPYDALLLLGDNVYPDGDPAELDRTVFGPFRAVLDDNTKLLAVLGNHDVNDGYGDVHIDAIGMPSSWYATRIDDVLVISLDSNDTFNPDQIEWLENTLANNDATWTIATMHHPPYSAGTHGSSLDVRDMFSPVFEKYGVQLVLAGHDHDYQRSTKINGVTYVVSGGAARLRDAGVEKFTEYSESILHFVDIEVRADSLDLSAVDQNGDVFDFVSISS